MNSKFCYALIVIFSFYVTSLGKKRKTYELLKIENCNDYPYTISKLTKTKIRNRRNGNSSVELTWVVDREMRNDIEGLASIWRCNAKGAQESCDYIVKNMKFKKLCEKMAMKNQFWTSFVEGVKPPLECPLKPGTYMVEIFLNDVFRYFFTIPSGIWKTQMFYLQEEKVICCTNIEFKVYEREL